MKACWAFCLPSYSAAKMSSFTLKRKGTFSMYVSDSCPPRAALPPSPATTYMIVRSGFMLEASLITVQLSDFKSNVQVPTWLILNLTIPVNFFFNAGPIASTASSVVFEEEDRGMYWKDIRGDSIIKQEMGQRSTGSYTMTVWYIVQFLIKDLSLS